MSFKTILVHLDEPARCGARCAIAARLARTYEAHLVGLCPMGVLPMPAPPSITLERPEIARRTYEDIEQHAKGIADAFEADMRGRGVASFESLVADSEALPAIASLARCSDLIVVGQTDPHHAGTGVASDFPEQVVLHAGRPVLIVPYAGQFEPIGSKVLVAWSPRREAARAARDALPFLQRATKVLLKAFASSEAEADEWGADLRDTEKWLARHGVPVTSGIEVTSLDVGNALLSCAADVSADLLVMGGYGHSRLTEFVLGGATRTVLASMTVPVLMSH
jgi:nucleotide-binding universal stress UspA family protein